MLGWLKRLFGGSGAISASETRRARWNAIEASIRAKYDAAMTNPTNQNHWVNVDYLSAKSANDYETRRILRARAGYEIANNCWARGIVNRRAAYLIGRGPRLQVKLQRPEESQQVQRAWNDWCKATNFMQTLRTFAVAKGGRCGEAIGLFKNNDLIANPVKLYVQPIEADQCMTPDAVKDDGTAVDGIELDPFGNPAFYHVLRNHPGDNYAWNMKYDRIPARFVLHWFRADRPGQVRGVPEIAPGLDLFGQLRRYTIATILAAEIVASYALFIKTNSPAEETYPLQPMSTETVHHGLLTALPEGWDPFQPRAEQPTTTFTDFEHAILVQLCSVLDIPFGIAVGDFSRASYASGRLDVQGFNKTVQIERGECVEEIVEPTFNEWLIEASRIPGLLPESVRGQAFAMDRRLTDDVPHVWHWDAMPFIDIKKEIEAYASAVSNNFCTRHFVSATVFGQDWDEVVAMRGEEAQTEDRFGVQVAMPGAPIAPVDKIPDENAEPVVEETE